MRYQGGNTSVMVRPEPKKKKKLNLTTAKGIHEFFAGATSFEDECARYERIKAANGGLRPAVLDAHPISTKFFAPSYPEPGIGYVCGE